jgi:hypothetical protein
VADRPIEQLTLQEMFTETERLTRELVEHLDQGFNPRAHQLLRLVRPIDNEPAAKNVTDVTVRTRSAELLESESYTDQTYEKLERFSHAIDSAVLRIVTGA